MMWNSIRNHEIKIQIEGGLTQTTELSSIKWPPPLHLLFGLKKRAKNYGNINNRKVWTLFKIILFYILQYHLNRQNLLYHLILLLHHFSQQRLPTDKVEYLH